MIFTDDAMIAAWLALLLFVVFVSWRTKIVGILFMAIGAVAWLFFYVWVHFGLWADYGAAVAWSRMAHLLNIASIALALYLMLLSARWKD